MAGVSIEVVSKAMGHSSTAITRRYGHLSRDYSRNEWLKLSGKSAARVNEANA